MAAATVALAACSFGGGTTDRLEDVATKTEAAGTARVTRTFSIQGVTQVMSGTVDFAERRAHLRSREFGLEELIDGDTGYSRLPGMKDWITAGPSKLRNRLLAGDPLAWVNALREATQPEELGRSHYSAAAGGSPVDVWIDESGRARRIRYRDVGDAAVTLEYAEYGLNVAIEPPASAATITAAEHQRRLRRSVRERCKHEPLICEVLSLSEPE